MHENGSELQLSDGSYIEFYKNGQQVGQRVEKVYEGIYFAGISLYMQAAVQINFGEKSFKHPPQGKDYKPYSELKIIV